MTIQFNEKGKFFTDIISKIPIPANIQTFTHRIEGNVYTRENKRLIDELTNESQFLAVTDAVIFDKHDKPIYQCEFLSINKLNIVWIIPVEEVIQSDPPTSGVKD